MKTTSNFYEFTLILKGASEHTENLEDKLYKAGCDDALINFRNGMVYLDFEREAHSLEQAVLSSIKNVESASFGAIVIGVAPEDWVSESEVAKRLGVKRQAVSLWVKGQRRKFFPKPWMKLADKSPLWKWREIIEWLYANKLIHEEELIVNAKFLENLNAALEERESDAKARKYRHALIKKLENHFAN